MKRALCTLVVGDAYRRRFAARVAPFLRAYAKAHGLSLVVLDKLLDDSPLGRTRSPAWQKCLILRHPRLRACDQVAWLDADMLPRPDAPDVFAGVPRDAFGAVEHFSSPTPGAFALAAANIRAHHRRHGVTGGEEPTPEAFYGRYGYDDFPDKVVQTGLLVLTPELHGPVLEGAYLEQRRPDSREMLFEMRPASWGLLRASPVAWLDPRFNAVWSTTLFSSYPFLADPDFQAAYRDRPELFAALKARCLAAAYAAAYFLHFAGTAGDMDAFSPPLP
ncbi:hypothetical protein [Solidesulfovibrio sp.]|uniref:hypothetical protein n=1 Tax=Solidesulfovibrio sp. TaxID=2910990 RepID=UPI0026371BA9|nr:hypothetical protein [Solidesulfovibrio sp.]